MIGATIYRTVSFISVDAHIVIVILLLFSVSYSIIFHVDGPEHIHEHQILIEKFKTFNTEWHP